MKLYCIHWRSLKDAKIKGIEDDRPHTPHDAFEKCERLNRVYDGCVYHFPQEIPSVTTVQNRLAGQRQKDS